MIILFRMSKESRRTAMLISFDNHTKKKNPIPIEQIVVLRRSGLTCAEIAKKFGCSSQNIATRLRAIDEGLQPVGKFRELRADLLALKQHKILESMSPRDLQKAGLKEKALAFGIYFDKERIELGKDKEKGGVKVEVQIVNFSGASQGQEPTVSSVVIRKEENEVQSPEQSEVINA